ncbi:MAG TPA: YggT family protein [Bacillota bacterium]|nr:YggT family protein [Bacillota bacterium]
MPGICYVIITIVKIFIYVLQLAMLLRAVMSWIPDMQENKFSDFLYTVTEPVVIPVRMLFEKMNWFQNMPLDVSFIVAYLLLAILSAILGAIV